MFVEQLQETMFEHGFRTVENVSRDISDASLLMKRQTLNMNRAIIVVELPQVPPDMRSYLKQLRKETAFRCRFFPLFWGIGIQVIISCPQMCKSGLHPQDYVAKIDNQWAIFQSLFLIDSEDNSMKIARSWGQTVTADYQDAILQSLAEHTTSPADELTF